MPVPSNAQPLTSGLKPGFPGMHRNGVRDCLNTGDCSFLSHAVIELCCCRCGGNAQHQRPVSHEKGLTLGASGSRGCNPTSVVLKTRPKLEDDIIHMCVI